MPEYISSWEKEITQKPQEIPKEVLQEAYKKFEHQQETSKIYQRLWDLNQLHIQSTEIPAYQKHFDGKIDENELTLTLQSLPLFDEMGSKKIIEEISQKEKLKKYARFADLAYSNIKELGWKMMVSSVELDPLEYRDITRIVNGSKKPQNDSEQYIYDYIHKAENIALAEQKLQSNKTLVWQDDTREILQYSSLQKPILLVQNTTHSPTASDIPFDYGVENRETTPLQKQLIDDVIQAKKEIKKLESQAKFDTLLSWYTILDAEPKTTKSSWFWAIALESPNGEIIVAVRGTELSDFWDLQSDISLMFRQVPKKQTKDMIDFLENIFKKIPKNKKIKIIGHSLWGALTQIASAIYGDRVEESMTFNAPGAKKLSVSLDPKDPYFTSFQKFMTQKDQEPVQELVTNVKGDSWLNLIADLWEDIGNYEVILKWLRSHSIVTTFEYIEALDEKSEELVAKKIEKNIKKKEKKENN